MIFLNSASINKLFYSVFLVILLNNLSTLPAFSQWTRTNGPGGGNISDITSDGINLFAASYSGVWQSTDHGDHWVPYNNFTGGNIFSPGIFSIATDSVHLFAGTANGVIYSSVINSGIWDMTFIGGGNVNGLEFMGGKLYAGTSGGIFMTGDSGVSWSSFNNGMVLTNVLSLATDGNFLFAGTLYGGLYRLANGDSVWVPVNASFANSDIRELLIDGNYIYAGTNTSSIKRSSDNGNSWASMNNGLPSTFVISSLGKFNGYVYASIYNDLFRSNNNGVSWQSTSMGYSDLIYSFAVQDSFLFAGTYDMGVQRAQGSSWTLKLNGMNNSAARAITVQGQRILAATNSGVFKTDDAGITWDGPYSPGSDHDVSSIIANDTLVFAGTEDQGLFKSINGGVSWTAINNGYPVCNWNGSTPFYCSVNDLHLLNNYVFAASEYKGVYRSSDMGITWDTLSNGLVTTSDKRVRTIESIGSNLFIGTASGKIFVSIDDGLTWNVSFSAPYSISNLTAIGTHIFASAFSTSGSGGVYSYQVGDTSWMPVNLGVWGSNGNVSSITHAGHFLFLDAGGQMIVSDDLGLTWNAVGNSLECYRVNSMLTVGTDVYATAGVRGVFKNNSLLTDIEDQISSKNCVVFPNPVLSSEQTITLDCKEFIDAMQIGLYDLRGALVRQLKISPGNKMQINLENVPDGFYFIRIVSPEKVYSFKIIVH